MAAKKKAIKKKASKKQAPLLPKRETDSRLEYGYPHTATAMKEV